MKERTKPWTRIALALVVATLIYNVIEASVALVAGVQADSILLVGFGLDAVIEFIAAALLLWRLSVSFGTASSARTSRLDRRVLRFVGYTLIALALYVLAQSGWILITRDAPAESLLGIYLAVLSLIVMPAIAWGKLRAADHLDSRALRAEAKETLACSYLSATMLVGLGLNAWLGWWWADPVAALLMVPWLIHEGREALEEEEDDDDDDDD